MTDKGGCDSEKCPYGAADCPKTSFIMEQVKENGIKLNRLILIFVLLHGAELTALLSIPW